MLTTLAILTMLVSDPGDLGGESLTFSPLSFTYHNFEDSEVEHLFKNKIEKHTTAHFGLHFKYERPWFQTMAWVFTDSFGNPAGGLTLGPKLDFCDYFNVGMVLGVYGRQHSEGQPLKTPLNTKIKGVDISAIAAVTGSVKIPVTRKVGLDLSALGAWKINNFSAGLYWRW